jgi:Polyketide cyclase / dehydrase and lipid transport
MPSGSVADTIPATSAEVFRLLHDYGRRLEWDTLLREARLDEGWTEAQLHAISTCTGHWYLGNIALRTEYVSFSPPQVAAVKMLNRPLFFESFAATIRHHDLADGSSTIEYKYHFTARPAWLRWLLHPAMAYVFRYETRKRMRALRRWFEKVHGRCCVGGVRTGR